MPATDVPTPATETGASGLTATEVRERVESGRTNALTVLNLNRDASPTQVNFSRTGDSVGMQLALNAQAAFRF